MSSVDGGRGGGYWLGIMYQPLSSSFHPQFVVSSLASGLIWTTSTCLDICVMKGGVFKQKVDRVKVYFLKLGW